MTHVTLVETRYHKEGETVEQHNHHKALLSVSLN